MREEQFQIFIINIVYIVGSLCLGILIENILLKKILPLTAKTKWKSDDIIVSSLRGLVLFWFGITGIYFASKKYNNSLISAIIDKALLPAIIISISLFIARIVIRFIKINSYASGAIIPATSIIINITRITIFTIGGIIILQTLGISVAPMLTALGVGGLAVALALQDTLSNLFSGIQIIASKQIKKNDYIRLDSGEEGYVEDISWKNTSIRMLSNNLIIIPNSKLSSIILTNYNLPNLEVAVLIEIGVSYDSDLEKVEEVTIQAAREILEKTEGGVKTFDPFIRYHSFNDSSIGFTVILRAQQFVNQYLIKHEFIKYLHTKYMEYDIEIPFPIRSLILKNKNEIFSQ